MKTGLGLQGKLIILNRQINIFKFWLLKTLFKFDVANLFLQRLDKSSIQAVLAKNGAVIGQNCDIETGLTFHNCKEYSNLIVGNNCHIGKNCFFDLRGKVIIEDNVVISMKTLFATHQDMNKSGLKHMYPATYKEILVRNNSYIGAGAILLEGVTINPFSMVAAGAVVVKDVPERTIVAGVPARFIKKIENI